MRFTVTASKEHHLRSESVMSAGQGMDVVDDFNDAGFTILLVLDSRYQVLSVAELRACAVTEQSEREGV